MTPRPLPRPPLILGGAGVLPPILCIALVLVAPRLTLPTMIAGGLYAALILSFLGGLWWMEALIRREPRVTPYVAAVAPSLIGWIILLPPLLGGGSLRIALLILGAVILVTPLVDARIGRWVHDMPGWGRLRLALSTGLGAATILLGLIGVM
ncbi:DUF3429 domain-containing protein [Sphingomonas sp. CFBP8993]|uniref:DUF3429 domain-containing protein n=1 Tax=Sphingomonas sp. CFBP8993 TaxID=3096526 RepID=UPI002A6B752D|nr:DUF3429 domain-containing protein [Sphingomonas sp. CFBP8993]MDY0957677.1 DUF3429 domain-containing protein [Sphingomonas sp. CFBP8993]